MSVQTELFDSMVADIITLTARPDLESETELALRTATNNAHLSDAYARDYITNSVHLPTPAYSAQFDLVTNFPRLRGLSGIRPLDSTYAPVSSIGNSAIEIIELEDIYDEYGRIKTNVAYLAGSALNILANTICYGFLVSYFVGPMTRRDDYNSWIAQLYPEAILYWAASIVLDTNGNEEKAAKYLKQTQQTHIPFLKSNFLLGVIR